MLVVPKLLLPNKYLNCDFSFTTKDTHCSYVKSISISCNAFWIGFEIVANSTSPILSVAWIVLIPSGAKNNTSPPISTMLSLARHPTLLDTSAKLKFAVELPVYFLISVLPKI